MFEGTPSVVAPDPAGGGAIPSDDERSVVRQREFDVVGGRLQPFGEFGFTALLGESVSRPSDGEGPLDRVVEDVVSHLQNGIVAEYRRLFALGLVLAAVSGLVPLYWDVPFLAQDHWYVHDIPLYNEVHVASAVAFDLGVYFVVVGALLTILSVVGAE